MRSALKRWQAFSCGHDRLEAAESRLNLTLCKSTETYEAILSLSFHSVIPMGDLRDGKRGLLGNVTPEALTAER